MGNSSSAPKVGIVVLNWNNYEDTKTCLQSLSDISYPNYERYVVDNGSTDGSFEALKEDFEEVVFIRNDQNLGFAGGNNQGIERALDDECQYVLLLNNDTVVTQEFLTHLVETAEKNSHVGAAGGLILDFDENIWYAGGSLHPTFIRYDRKTEVPEGTGEYRTDVIVGTLILLNRDALDDVGLLDDQYWFGGEDLELCYRMRDKGWDVLVNPSAVIYHEVGGTGGVENSFSAYQSSWNNLQFSRKHHTLLQKIVFILYFSLWNVYKTIDRIYNGEFRHVIAALHGIIDFLWGENARNKYL